MVQWKESDCTEAVLRGKFIAMQSYLKQRLQWQATPEILPRKSNRWRSLVGCNPWGCYKLDMTEQLKFHFSFSCIEEGNGNPLQCSCLENPRDRGAWCAAIYGVTESRTWLKWLSSNSSSNLPQETRKTSNRQPNIIPKTTGKRRTKKSQS